MFGKRQKARRAATTPTPLQRAQHARDPEYADMLLENGTVDRAKLDAMVRKYADSKFPVVPPPVATPGDIAWLREEGEDSLANQLEEAMPTFQMLYPLTYQRALDTEETRLGYQRANPQGPPASAAP